MFLFFKFPANHLKKTYRLANPDEESKGIDGFIGDMPISIKPITYKTKMGLNEEISVPIVFYDKKKSEIVLYYDDSENSINFEEPVLAIKKL